MTPPVSAPSPVLPAVPAQRLTDEEIIHLFYSVKVEGGQLDYVCKVARAIEAEVLRRAAPPPAEAAASPEDPSTQQAGEKSNEEF